MSATLPQMQRPCLTNSPLCYKMSYVPFSSSSDSSSVWDMFTGHPYIQVVVLVSSLFCIPAQTPVLGPSCGDCSVLRLLPPAAVLFIHFSCCCLALSFLLFSFFFLLSSFSFLIFFLFFAFLLHSSFLFLFKSFFSFLGISFS